MSLLGSAARARPADRPRPDRYGRFTTHILWVLHGWLAMFYLGAGLAKMLKPAAWLEEVMIWPAHVPVSVVDGVGIAEITLAVALAAPLLSARRGRLVSLAAAALLSLNALSMTVFYAMAASVGLSLLNAALVILGLALMNGHRSDDAIQRGP